VTCTSCGAVSVEEFESEITVHSPRLKNIDKPPVLVFGKLLVCLNCGKAQFDLQQPQLKQLSADSRKSKIN
jgi:hypothetical protein